MPLLRVRAAAAEIQPLSQTEGLHPFSTDVLATLTLFLLVLLNPVSSRAVRPTPGVPALTSRVSASLSFVFLTPPAASRQSPAAPRAPRAPGLSLLSCVCRPRVRLLPCAGGLPATSRPARAPGAPGLSLDLVSTPEFQSSVRCLVARAPSSRSQSAVSRVPSASPPSPPCRWPASCQLPATPQALLELPVSVWIQ